MFERICIVCGEPFTAARNAHYCGECKADRVRALRAEYKQRVRAGKVRRLGSAELCAHCGNPFILGAAMQKYCSATCAAEGRRTYFRRRYQALKNDA